MQTLPLVSHLDVTKVYQYTEHNDQQHKQTLFTDDTQAVSSDWQIISLSLSLSLSLSTCDHCLKLAIAVIAVLAPRIQGETTVRIHLGLA